MTRAGRNGCLVFLGILIGAAIIVPTGWGFYNMFRPRQRLELLFQQVIRDAPISDLSGRDGWESADVTALVCPRVDAETLNGMSVRKQTSYPPLALDAEDSWEVAQDRNFFSACATYSVRYLTIEIDQKTGQCHAHVQPRPFCSF